MKKGGRKERRSQQKLLIYDCFTIGQPLFNCNDFWFNEKQGKWLELIKKHVIKNMIIKEQDFEEQILFSRKGTWEDWNKVFDHFHKLKPKSDIG